MFGIFKDKAPKVPLLDGPLIPNNMIDRAASISVAEPDDICVAPDDSLLVTSGKSILRLTDWDKKQFVSVAEFKTNVCALACREDGVIGVGLEESDVMLISGKGIHQAPWKDSGIGFNAVRGCHFSSDGSLMIADACDGEGAPPYLHDLFQESDSGRILRLNDNGGAELVAEGLQFPHGLVEIEPDVFIISESWSSDLCKLSCKTSSKTSVLSGLPGYTARIHPLDFGGYALSCFARRDPLIDFVLSEKKFVQRMKKELAPECWITPRLSSDIDYRFPIQSGATRLFGEIKPWAPSLSYGLVIILDRNFVPMASAHSRANGRRHGITTALEWRGDLIAVSKGNNELLKIEAMEQMI